ncbi:hypothetical protein Tco_0413840 [Tanacetum coccineum]
MRGRESNISSTSCPTQAFGERRKSLRQQDFSGSFRIANLEQIIEDIQVAIKKLVAVSVSAALGKHKRYIGKYSINTTRHKEKLL